MMHLDSIFGTTGLAIHCTDVGVLQREHAGGQQDSSFFKSFVTHTAGYRCSPLCTQWCIFRAIFKVKFLLRTLYSYGNSAVFACWLSLRWLFLLKDLLHTLQSYKRPSLFKSWWTLRWFFRQKHFLHTLQFMYILHCVQADGHSEQSYNWMISYTHCNSVDVFL
jgi:hypothetical protein